MNLLPKSSKEFASTEYWEQFFRKRGERAFEWYGGYLDLCGVLHKYIKPKDKVLVVGCGNSELSERLYDAGCQNLANIDVSEVVIRQMSERNASKRPLMTFQLMDATQTTFSDSHFQAVLDKGTLDAILTDTEERTLKIASDMLSEISRLLQIGGRYLCVSLAQAHVLEKLVRHFSEVRQIPGFPQVFEMMSDEEGGKPVRWSSPEELMEAVKERQRYALLRNKLQQNQSSQEVSLDLCDGDTGKSRYTFYIVDCPIIKQSHSNHFAIFIIPQGRETEWLFGSEPGRRQLAGSVGFRRLIIVALHRDQQYDGMQAIQAELSAKVLELAPAGLPDNQQVPFLSTGADIGNRVVQHRGKSELSGEFVIEDVRGDGTDYFRRLIFLSNQNVVQSEVRLLPGNTNCGQKKKKKVKKNAPKSLDESTTLTSPIIDKGYLCCEHHKAMISGLALLCKNGMLPENLISVLVIGLGGGSLSLFIHDYIGNSQVEAVEIDPSVLDVACQWFGFSQDERMRVHLGDGLVCINDLAKQGKTLYDVVMFDVDSKDTSVGMSCPPPAFVEKDFLINVHKILKPDGIFVLNLVCRDSALNESVIKVLRDVFPLIYKQKIEDEVNEILFCCSGSEKSLCPLGLIESAKNLEKQLKKTGLFWDKTYDLAEMLKNVKII
ncbi:methyltransferase 13 isoform X1 [Pelobates cultripes]|uniref:eEF1A lysine and N-terminal methyltransferase n=1 Tax=Pelobates cultripes TaxID=61616 RepID=A0AAD1SUE9_PELCU|nr:methyltransferase 13 isoform X1 [Pelobates cultripes]